MVLFIGLFYSDSTMVIFRILEICHFRPGKPWRMC